MAQKNATYKVYNGSSFDEIMFKTLATQVVEDATHRFCTDTEKNLINNGIKYITSGTAKCVTLLTSSGVKIAIQSGYIRITSTGWYTITFPVRFKDTYYSAVVSAQYDTVPANAVTRNLLESSLEASTDRPGANYIHWVAIGLV